MRSRHSSISRTTFKACEGVMTTERPIASPEEEAAGILAAAQAMVWAMRPVLPMSPPSEHDAQSWWEHFSEHEQGNYLYRARCAVEAWERHWKNKQMMGWRPIET